MDTININAVSKIIDILLCNAVVEQYRDDINRALEEDEDSFISYKVADIMANNKNELYDLNTYVNILNNAVSEFKGILEKKQRTHNTTLILNRIKEKDYTEEDLYNIVNELTNCYLNTFANSISLNRVNGKWQAIIKNRLHAKIIEAAGLTEPIPPVFFCMERPENSTSRNE